MADHMNFEAFRVAKAGRIDLNDFPTDLADAGGKKELKASLESDRERIAELQEVMYAQGEHALLIVFQAMDAAGKDSAIEHVLSGVNPQGCQVTSFKAPSSEELTHDLLWRHAKAVPARGMIGVHNRSHYEEVLVVKVHPEFLAAQHLPGVDGTKVPTAFWGARYASIRNFEEHLATQGVTVLKFYLHMSKAVQKERFLERIDDPKKNWKFNLGDVKERAHWEAYQQAYAEAIGATAAPHAPWYIVPADDQWESRAIVARLVRHHLEALPLRLPVLSDKAKEGLAEARELLRKE
ncbi:MAG: polyphosphate kinase 2 family protein [Flavobacteriales bacterium]|nr:polyphosphate kinase 2 family protein [Flavobacteriales bacterium]